MFAKTPGKSTQIFRAAGSRARRGPAQLTRRGARRQAAKPRMPLVIARFVERTAAIQLRIPDLDCFVAPRGGGAPRNDIKCRPESSWPPGP